MLSFINANRKSGQEIASYRAVRRELLSQIFLSLTSGFAKVSGTIGHPPSPLTPPAC